MNYYLDAEFLEGTQKKWFGQTKPTIDLISIGIVCEDGREFYAISKDFNLKEAWNRWEQRTGEGDKNNIEPKKYWIRENVLKPIWIELRAKEVEEYNIAKNRNVILDFPMYGFTCKSIKRLINKYGKTNKQIASDIRSFTGCITPEDCKYVGNRGNERIFTHFLLEENKEVEWQMDLSVPEKEVKSLMWKYYYQCGAPECKFYGYYSDYDWVVFCWLFGKMVDLPKGFPMYCIDLKQQLDEKQNSIKGDRVELINDKNYPRQTNEHNALADARWNLKLHNFLKIL